MNRNAVEAKEKLRVVEASVADLDKSLQESTARAADAEGLSEKLRKDLEAAAAAAAGEAQRAKDAEAGVGRATAEAPRRKARTRPRPPRIKLEATGRPSCAARSRARLNNAGAVQGAPGQVAADEQWPKSWKAKVLEGRLDEERAPAESRRGRDHRREWQEGHTTRCVARHQKVLARRARDLQDAVIAERTGGSAPRRRRDHRGLLQDAEDVMAARRRGAGRLGSGGGEEEASGAAVLAAESQSTMGLI